MEMRRNLNDSLHRIRQFRCLIQLQGTVFKTKSGGSPHCFQSVWDIVSEEEQKRSVKTSLCGLSIASAIEAADPARWCRIGCFVFSLKYSVECRGPPLLES